MNREKSALGRLYRRIYNALCGEHPQLRPWHFQYLDAFYLYRALKHALPRTQGSVVLDVGCGDAPYQHWFARPIQHIGIDTQAGGGVRHIIDGQSPWPLQDESVDVVLCTQVLEHVMDLPHLLIETDRCLRGAGQLVASFPFIYNEHGSPHDYRRFSVHGAQLLFPGWRVLTVQRQGGIGSTLGLLWLNWRDAAMNRSFATRLLKALLLPLWLVESLVVNMLGLLLDKLDRTDSFYNNVMIILQKPADHSNQSVARQYV